MTDIFAEDKQFRDLGLEERLLRALDDMGFVHPTLVQDQLIPLALAGRDVLGQARTGTGKTAAFGLPILQQVDASNRAPQALILVPTRELAIQVANEISDLGRHTDVLTTAIYGGGSMRRQAEKLEKGRHIIVGTPGRIMDMHQRGLLRYEHMRFAVLDEVDRMLDIGFRDDIRKILSKMPQGIRTIFVSATISGEIEKLARQYMRDPEKVVAVGASLTVEQVDQHYLTVQPWDKRRLLYHLLTREEPGLSVVFCRTKRTVDELASYLAKKKVDVQAIHGDMYQGKRNRTIEKLRCGGLKVLIASDVAARGLDVAGISHVINYDLPEDPEIYVHRIGRTARTGRKGVAWSLVTPEQGPLLTAIEKLINREVPELEYPDFEPGPVPEHVRAQQERKQEETSRHRQEVNRFKPKPPPSEMSEKDRARFPGGLVPTQLPKRALGGRVRSRRPR